MNKTNPFAQVLFLVVALLLPMQALAHAMPLHADPGAGAVLARAPARVTVRFDAKLIPRASTLIVKDARGWVVSDGDGRVDAHDPAVLSTRLTVAGRGIYHVYWHAVSRDGHRSDGDYTFTVQ